MYISVSLKFNMSIKLIIVPIFLYQVNHHILRLINKPTKAVVLFNNHFLPYINFSYTISILSQIILYTF
jgi:hypothetical protein